MNRPLIVLDGISINRGAHAVLHDFSWAIREGETWAITGPIGSGKTTLAEALLGKHFPSAGSIQWPFIGPGRYPSQAIQFVAFQENSRLFHYSGHYYQQRFEFADSDEPLTLADYLASAGAGIGVGASPGISVSAGASPGIGAGAGIPSAAVLEAAGRLGIAEQLPLSFIKLSNGQTRRARIARALLAKPELLILDDPYLGVDAAGREELSQLLGQLVNAGQRLILICSPEAAPEWITHRLDLPGLGHGEPGRQLAPAPASAPGPPPTPASTVGEPILELRKVKVAHGGRTILKEISWTVRAGERWVVFGPNGSGKTTLLSLLCGDHPQAFSNDIRLFGRRRGSGESIWDVKRRVGLVSPEFHLYFSEPLSAERTAATGFFDGVTDHPTTPEQEAAIRDLFAQFGITRLLRSPFRQLSTGEQRLVLLIRALVKKPPLLILDEPFQGFDAQTVRMARDWLDRQLAPDQTLLFVSHHEHEIPATVNQRLELR